MFVAAFSDVFLQRMARRQSRRSDLGSAGSSVERRNVGREPSLPGGFQRIMA